MAGATAAGVHGDASGEWRAGSHFSSLHSPHQIHQCRSFGHFHSSAGASAGPFCWVRQRHRRSIAGAGRDSRGRSPQRSGSSSECQWLRHRTSVQRVHARRSGRVIRTTAHGDGAQQCACRSGCLIEPAERESRSRRTRPALSVIDPKELAHSGWFNDRRVQRGAPANGGGSSAHGDRPPSFRRQRRSARSPPRA